MNIPTGNVTFLFTDIEGSTKLAQEFPETLPKAIERHYSILQNAIESNHGFVFEIVGDSICCSFEKAEHAVKAAVDAQLNLSKEKWNGAVIKVRIGIHSGNAEWKGETYMGYITLARTARVMSSGHGEQIIISDNTYELTKKFYTVKGKNISFRDLGERRLKDVVQPIRLFQVLCTGLREEFPPLKTLEARPNNLPVQLTNFIGREAEMKQLKDLLKKTHLLTLTGSGGAGKTRLAMQIAANEVDDFANGVWFVELASLFEHSHLPQAILKVFGLKEDPKRNPEDTLCDYLRDKEILIILDNCEHLIDECSKLTEKLLSNSPKLKIISTSREALRCSGETTHRILPLDTPDPKKVSSPEMLSQYEAVRLFIERASAVHSNFRVTDENAPALAQICYQLDGIPLAIELAAARIKVLSVEKIYERLNDRFKLLTGGHRTALPRQQTLRALIDWSYDLLSEEEKILWQRLSVFTGGWTLEAAEEVCSDERIRKEEILELLNLLAGKSIIIFVIEKERYSILETLKQYGEEKLKLANESEDVASKHLHYFMEFSQTAEPKLNGSDVQFWMERLEAEHNNLQSAIDWSVSSGEREKGAGLAGALGNFWFKHGHYSAGIRLLEIIIKNPEGIGNPPLGKVLNCAGKIAVSLGEYEKAQMYYEESLAIYREIKNKEGISGSVFGLGNLAFHQGNFVEAQKIYEESLALSREIGFKLGTAQSLNNLGNVASYQGNYEQAQKFYEECIALYREIGAKSGIDSSLNNLGTMALARENYEQAKELFEEGLVLYKEIGDKSGIALSLNNLGNVLFNSGNYEQAQKFYDESLIIYRELGDKRGIAQPLHNLGSVALVLENYEQAKKINHESLTLCREIGDKRVIAESLNNLVSIESNLGNYELARKLSEECLILRREIGDKFGFALSLEDTGNMEYDLGNYEKAEKLISECLIIYCQLENKKGITKSLIGLAGIKSACDHFSRALILLGAVESAIETFGTVLEKREIKLQKETTNQLHEKMSNEEFGKYFEQGKKLTLEEAAQLAVSS